MHVGKNGISPSVSPIYTFFVIVGSISAKSNYLYFSFKTLISRSQIFTSFTFKNLIYIFIIVTACILISMNWVHDIVVKTK